MTVIPFKDAMPKLAPDCFVAPSASVIGDVEIGAQSSIWFGAVVRGDVYYIRLGERVNIQDNSVIHVTTGRHATIIEDEVTVGHRVILHGCTVKKNALVGMGSIIMDRAEIGEGAIVGAGALVTEGMKIPAGMLAVGSPAKVKRPVQDKELEFLKFAPEHYADLAAQYASQLGWR